MCTRLVLLHGSLSAAEQWSSYIELLPNFEIVTPDLPGHGIRIAEKFTTESTMAIIDQEVSNTDQPVILAGHSLGGYMALLYAARNPGKLAGLALMGTSADPKTKLAVLYSGFAKFSQGFNQKLLYKIRNGIASALQVDPGDIPAKNSYAVLPDAWGAVISECSAELLSKVDCPVLIVNGQFDQMRLHEKRFANLANTEPITIARASHLAPLTHKKQVAEVLANFVQQVAKSTS